MESNLNRLKGMAGKLWLITSLSIDAWHMAGELNVELQNFKFKALSLLPALIKGVYRGRREPVKGTKEFN